MSNKTKRRYICAIDQDPHIVLYYRENNKLKHEIRKVDWYFGILKSDFQKPEIKIKIDQLKTFRDRYQKIFKTEEKGDYVLIYCLKRSFVSGHFKKLGIQTFEADLGVVERFWLDNDLEIAEEYKIAFFDIETDDTKEINIGQASILSFAIKDLEGKEYFYSLKDFEGNEKDLLKKFKEIINQYDLMSGWSSWRFDLPYIKARMQIFQIQWPELRRLAHIDLQQRMIYSYRFDTRIRSFSLDYISKRFLNESKIVRKKKIIELYRTDYEKFKKYNLRDVQLLYNLEKKNKILEVLIKQAIWCNLFPKRISPTGKSVYRMLDTLILSRAHLKGLMGTTPKYSRTDIHYMSDQEKLDLMYPGGYVFDPIKGLHDNVYTFDFKSLYPSIVRTWNIGLETMRSEFKEKTNKNPADTFFIKEPESLISSVLEFLLDKRKEYKQRILKLVEEGKIDTPEYEAAHADEVVVKELSNSLYGIQGKKDGRYFSKELASSITLAGQRLLKDLKKYSESEDHKCFYGDTDSIMIQVKKGFDPIIFLKKYHEWLKKELKKKCNIDTSYIRLDLDKYYKRFILVDKKTYTGWVLNREGKKTNYIYTRGLEVIKSSSCALVVKLQDELIKMLLKKNHSKKYYIDWLLNKRKIIFDDVSKEDLILTTKINKPFDKYKNKTLPVILAEKKLKREGILLNREVHYIITSINPKLDGIEPQFWKGKFNKEYYWNRALLPCCDRLLRVVFPEISWRKDFKLERQGKLL